MTLGAWPQPLPHLNLLLTHVARPPCPSSWQVAAGVALLLLSGLLGQLGGGWPVLDLLQLLLLQRLLLACALGVSADGDLNLGHAGARHMPGWRSRGRPSATTITIWIADSADLAWVMERVSAASSLSLIMVLALTRSNFLGSTDSCVGVVLFLALVSNRHDQPEQGVLVRSWFS